MTWVEEPFFPNCFKITNFEFSKLKRKTVICLFIKLVFLRPLKETSGLLLSVLRKVSWSSVMEGEGMVDIEDNKRHKCSCATVLIFHFPFLKMTPWFPVFNLLRISMLSLAFICNELIILWKLELHKTNVICVCVHLGYFGYVQI